MTRKQRSLPASIVIAIGATLSGIAQTSGDSGVAAPQVYRTWKTYTTRDGLPHDRVRAIRVDGDRVWIGTEGGLAVFDGQHMKRWTTGDGLPYPVISAIDVDARTSDVWLGTLGRGIIRFSGGRFDMYHQLNSGLSGNLVFAIRVVDGMVWCATNGGVSVYDARRKTWSLYAERRANAPERVFTDLTTHPRTNRVFGSAWCDGLWRFDPGLDEPTRLEITGNRATSKPRTDTMIGVSVTGSSIWAATQETLYRRTVDGSRHTWPLGRAVGASTFVYGVAARDESQVWLATEAGPATFFAAEPPTWITYRHSGGTMTRVTVVTGGDQAVTARLTSTIPNDRVRCIDFDDDGVWIGTDSGLAYGTDAAWLASLPATTQSRREEPNETTAERRHDRQGVTRPVSDDARRKLVPIAAVKSLNRTVALPGATRSGVTPRGNLDLLAFQLAIERANETGGGAKAMTFEPVQGAHGYLRYAWGTKEDDWTVFAFERNVAGMVSSLDPSSRIATATALYTAVPVVNASAQPVAVDERDHPWLYRCPRHDPRQVVHLLTHLIHRRGVERIAVVRTTGFFTPAWAHELDRASTDLGVSLVTNVLLDSVVVEDSAPLADVARSNVQAVVALCDWSTAAHVLRALRNHGSTQWFVGSDRIVCDDFVNGVGADPGSVLAPLPCDHLRDQEAYDWFARRYRLQRIVSRPATAPIDHALISFEATAHLLEAARIAGTDREAVRRQLRAMSETPIVLLQHGVWRVVTTGNH